ncbi:PDZ domain-containing protein (plasmid) [Pedobacter sp. BS3]|uniref:PDZ domain-containing protein n=1 Tax=Pedobacter sp. BS3 TaxID=2567937 RepID=UPI0011EDCE2A|nr:PDZ domain-containing protein [Pedobacter sp. BS3]TZF85758.1 PDZ domain-containing protein [Pedobacter sp. BS3]
MSGVWRAKLKRGCTALLLLVLVFPFSLKAQSLHLLHRKRLSIPFKVVKNLIVIPLMLNDKGPFNFIVDSGVGLFIITDPTLKDSLHVKNIRQIIINGFGEGHDISAYIAPSIDINIGNAILGNVSAAIFKEDTFNLSSYTGMPVHGLIGFELFNSFTVRINYATNVLTLYRPESMFIPKKGVRIPLSIEEHKPYIQASVTLDDQKTIPAHLIVDTGAGHPLSLETISGVPIEPPETKIAANLGVGLAGPINGYLGRIARIRIGKYELNQVISSFPDYNDVTAKINSISRNGNIGYGILKRFNLVFDYARGYIYLKPFSTFKTPFEHDMTGMELLALGDKYDHIVISRVEPGSAAAEAGLESGDEILAINFKAVKTMSMQEIDDLFASKEGRSFMIDFIRHEDKQKAYVILTLKRRI